MDSFDLFDTIEVLLLIVIRLRSQFRIYIGEHHTCTKAGHIRSYKNMSITLRLESRWQ